MTEHRRFMTYTQMEKAYRRILAGAPAETREAANAKPRDRGYR